MTVKRRGVVSDIDYFEYAKYKIRVPISLNKQSGTFTAEYADEHFSSETLQGLKAELHDYVYKNLCLNWMPVIEVTLSGSARSITDVINSGMHSGDYYRLSHQKTAGSLDMLARRYWIAQRADGAWMRCEEWFSRDYEADGTTSDEERKRLESEDKGTFCSADFPSDRRVNARQFYEAKSGFNLPWTYKPNHFGEPKETHFLPYDEDLWSALNTISDKLGELTDRLQKLVGTQDGRQKLTAFAQKMLPAPESEVTK